MPPPQVVFVSGAPGAGKSTLAVPLAAELGFPLVSKDQIKETLHDALGAPPADLIWSQRLGAAAMELLWALAAAAPRVLVEANFRPHDPRQRARLAGLAARPVEVYCHCDPALAARRYDERAARCHPVHVVASLPPRTRAEYDGPVGVGGLVTVDTTARVDIPAVATAVRARLPVVGSELLPPVRFGAHPPSSATTRAT
jgi:predicted kinase